MAKTYKRFLAYIVDFILINLIFIILYKLIPNGNISLLNHDLNKTNEYLLNNSIELKTYLDNFAMMTYEIDKANVIQLGLNTLLFIIYFIIIPIVTKGYTLGLYLFNLKIDGKINFKNLLIRSIVINGLFYMILNIINVSIFNYKIYFILTAILGFMQFLLVIISIFMIIYRKDKKGLQDILSNTQIVQKEEKKKVSHEHQIKSVSGSELLEIIRIGQIQPDIGIDFTYKDTKYMLDYDSVDPTIMEDLLSNILIILRDEKGNEIIKTTSYDDFYNKAIIDSKHIKDIKTGIMCDIDTLKKYFESVR